VCRKHGAVAIPYVVVVVCVGTAHEDVHKKVMGAAEVSTGKCEQVRRATLVSLDMCCVVKSPHSNFPYVEGLM